MTRPARTRRSSWATAQTTSDGGAEYDANDQAQTELANDKQREVGDPVVVGLLDPRDQAKRERDRHRIVPARLGLQRARDPSTDVRKAKRGEHRRSIGRGNDRAQQGRLQPREVEQRRAATAVSSALTTTPTVLSSAAGTAT